MRGTPARDQRAEQELGVWRVQQTCSYQESSPPHQALTNVIHCDGHRFPTHRKEGQRVLMPLAIDEGVPSEVNGQNVILGSHTAEVPLDGVIKAES